MMLSDNSVRERLNEARAYILIDDFDQATAQLDVLELERLLTPIRSRDKGRSDSTLPAVSFGLDRVRLTVNAVDRCRLALSQMNKADAVQAIDKAIAAWA